MKAAQIMKYNKNIHIKVMDIPIPKMGDHDVLIRVKAAAVNPVVFSIGRKGICPRIVGVERRRNSSQPAHGTEQIVCEKRGFSINQTDDFFTGRIKI